MTFTFALFNIWCTLKPRTKLNAFLNKHFYCKINDNASFACLLYEYKSTIDRLYDEMQRRCIQLADEFLVINKERMAKSQLMTLEINQSLTKQLNKLDDRSTMLLGQNRSNEMAMEQIKRDVEVMTEISQKMLHKFRSYIKVSSI